MSKGGPDFRALPSGLPRCLPVYSSHQVPDSIACKHLQAPQLHPPRLTSHTHPSTPAKHVLNSIARKHRSSTPPRLNTLNPPYPPQVLDSIARKHRISIPNVASKWVLDRPGVAGIILGARNADHVQVGLLVGRAGGGV